MGADDHETRRAQAGRLRERRVSRPRRHARCGPRRPVDELGNQLGWGHSATLRSSPRGAALAAARGRAQAASVAERTASLAVWLPDGRRPAA